MAGSSDDLVLYIIDVLHRQYVIFILSYLTDVGSSRNANCKLVGLPLGLLNQLHKRMGNPRLSQRNSGLNRDWREYVCSHSVMTTVALL